MNGAPRPHHRNIYCIIYSASPLVQGERTHINFQPHSSPPHSSSCLLLKAEVPARSLPFFHSFFFFFRSFSLLFFLPRCGTGSIHRGPEALTQSGLPAVDDLHSPLSLFFYLLTCFSVFFSVLLFLFIQLEQLNFTKGLQTRTNWDLWDAFSVFRDILIMNIWLTKIS